MIPIALAPEPPGFDQDVRQRGERWLKKKKIDLNGLMPEKAKPPAHWQKYTKQLWAAYAGTCAYLAIYFDWPLGAASTDHFLPKSKEAKGVYDWENYRLACLAVNRDKGIHDVLDPIGLKPETFHLNLASGKIYPNASLGKADWARAKKTIDDLGLDDPDTADMRAKHYQNYVSRLVTIEYLREKSPFVHFEVVRQGLDVH